MDLINISSWTSPSPIPHITTNLNDISHDPEDNDTIEFPIYTSQGDIKAIMTVAKYQNILSIAVSMFISLMIKIYIFAFCYKQFRKSALSKKRHHIMTASSTSPILCGPL